MTITRRAIIRSGAATIAAGFATPGLLSSLALAQGARSRALVVLDLQGGNDWLSLLAPYNDPAYYSRRPTIALAAGRVLQVGRDSAGRDLGLHPRLTGLASLFNRGQLAFIQRVGYENSSRSHFLGNDIWASADVRTGLGTGWLGRYLDSLPSPVDPLEGWCTASDTPHTLRANNVRVPSIPSTAGYTFQSPNSGAEVLFARDTAGRLSSNQPAGAPEVTFVNSNIQSALATLDRVAAVTSYVPTAPYPNTSLGGAFRAVAGALAKDIGTSIFWVQTGGYDTHASEGTNETTGTYTGLMATLNDALLAFSTDLANQGLFEQTLLLQFSEFGRRITENGSKGTDHGAAILMMALGGRVRGGLYGTAPELTASPQNTTLENSGSDVRYETDFRSVYATVIDQWLGADSVALLGGNFRASGPDFIW